MNDIINPEIFKANGLQLSDTLGQSEWQNIHRTVLTCSKASRAWLRQSREFASGKWGADYVAEVEIQLELDLGIESKEKPERIELNPDDKSKAIVTIEGICQQFTLWHRKMATEIETWDRPRLEKALALLTPMEEQARRIRERLATPPVS